MKKIAVLFKKLINKILKFDWIADIDVSFHMIDQFRFFNEFFKSIKKRIIKIEKRKLYSNQCETTIMKMKNKKCRLTNVFYVFDFDVNLLFEIRFIKKKLKFFLTTTICTCTSNKISKCLKFLFETMFM